MALAEAELPFQDVAVIDDNDKDAATVVQQLMALGLTPVPVDIEDRDLEDVVAEVRTRAQAAICDHYLKHKRVDFSGAQAAARLTEVSIPTCVITMFAGDGDVGIRSFRGGFPSLLLRTEAGVDELADALMRAYRELHEGTPVDRVAYRTAISIERLSSEADQPVADVLISGWHSEEAVRFPISLLPPALRPDPLDALVGTVLFVEVNLGAERAVDLFFRNFEMTPPSTLGERLLRDAPQLDWGTGEDA